MTSDEVSPSPSDCFRDAGCGVSTYALAEELGMSRQGVDKLLKRAMEKLHTACHDNIEQAAYLEELCNELRQS